MPTYKLIKDNAVANVIIADEVDSIMDQYDSIELVEPEPVLPPSRMITAVDVRNDLTFSEKVKWDNGSTANIVTAKIEFEQPRTVEDATEILDFLVAEDDISKASRDKILTI